MESGTIRCDFNQDWCKFAITTNGDAAKNGFGWVRKTVKQINDQGLEGPDKGN